MVGQRASPSGRNVTRALPQFVGHYQPHLPGDLGFYDLRVPDVMRRQSGAGEALRRRRLLLPLLLVRGQAAAGAAARAAARPTRSSTFPFCLCWANENWTRRWDGREHDVLIGQNHTADDDSRFIARPRAATARPALHPRRRQAAADRLPAVALAGLRAHRSSAGASIAGRTDSARSSSRWCSSTSRPARVRLRRRGGVPAPQARARAEPINHTLAILNPDFPATLATTTTSPMSARDSAEPDYRVVHGRVTPRWDNEARKPRRGYRSPIRRRLAIGSGWSTPSTTARRTGCGEASCSSMPGTSGGKARTSNPTGATDTRTCRRRARRSRRGRLSRASASSWSSPRRPSAWRAVPGPQPGAGAACHGG